MFGVNFEGSCSYTTITIEGVQYCVQMKQLLELIPDYLDRYEEIEKSFDYDIIGLDNNDEGFEEFVDIYDKEYQRYMQLFISGNFLNYIYQNDLDSYIIIRLFRFIYLYVCPKSEEYIDFVTHVMNILRESYKRCYMTLCIVSDLINGSYDDASMSSFYDETNTKDDVINKFFKCSGLINIFSTEYSDKIRYIGTNMDSEFDKENITLLKESILIANNYDKLFISDEYRKYSKELIENKLFAELFIDRTHLPENLEDHSDDKNKSRIFTEHSTAELLKCFDFDVEECWECYMDNNKIPEIMFHDIKSISPEMYHFKNGHFGDNHRDIIHNIKNIMNNNNELQINDYRPVKFSICVYKILDTITAAKNIKAETVRVLYRTYYTDDMFCYEDYFKYIYDNIRESLLSKANCQTVLTDIINILLRNTTMKIKIPIVVKLYGIIKYNGIDEYVDKLVKPIKPINRLAKKYISDESDEEEPVKELAKKYIFDLSDFNRPVMKPVKWSTKKCPSDDD